jgi:hypothetical protein
MYCGVTRESITDIMFGFCSVFKFVILTRKNCIPNHLVRLWFIFLPVLNT